MMKRGLVQDKAEISHIMAYWMAKIFLNDFNIPDIVSETIKVKERRAIINKIFGYCC